jgi:uncharacterized membrane protein YbjE (DUF340 family)
MINYHEKVVINLFQWEITIFCMLMFPLFIIAGLRFLKSMFFDLKSAIETTLYTLIFSIGMHKELEIKFVDWRAKVESEQKVDVIDFQIL